MKQTRSKLTRRQKVTVRWLPVELIIEIFRAVQKLIEFSQAAQTSITRNQDQEYNDNLLAFALSSREWTVIAQAELFRTVILENRSKTGRFLEAVRGNEKLKAFSRAVTSLTMGWHYNSYETEGLGDDLDEIALYCPNVVEILCEAVDVRLEYFRSMKKLAKLNLSGGSILPPSTSRVALQTIAIPITLLALDSLSISSPIDSSSLPLLRSLHLTYQPCGPILQLLPQLDCMHIKISPSAADTNLSIQVSTSMTSLIYEGNIAELDNASKTIIKERIMELRVSALFYGDANSTLAAILAGSKAMKKLILDGVPLSGKGQVSPKLLETLKIMKAACKKKNIELWKENFEVGNGKVDLEK